MGDYVRNQHYLSRALRAYSMHCSNQYSVEPVVWSAQCGARSVECAVWSTWCGVCIVEFGVCSDMSAVISWQYVLYSVQC